MTTRGRFQGVATVVRFNWHLYALAIGGAAATGLAARWVPAAAALPLLSAAALGVFAVFVSLTATWLAYDASPLYRLQWLDPWMPARGAAANIHAGFDESTALLRARYPGVRWDVFDFYDPVRHTEVSIRRARRAHPPAKDTRAIPTNNIPLPDGAFDRIVLFFAAHEIRDPEERVGFFNELHRLLAPGGRVVVTEHLRDLPNIAAYNLGAWHFHSPADWQATFTAARFTVETVIKPAPLITTYILQSHGKSD